MNFDPRIFITVGTPLGLDALEEYNTLRMNPSQSLNQYMDFVSFSLLSSIPLWGYNHNCSPIILEDSYISYNFRMKIILLSRKHPGVHSSKKCYNEFFHHLSAFQSLQRSSLWQDPVSLFIQYLYALTQIL